MRKNLLYFIITAAVIGLAVSIFIVFFEVAETSEYVPPADGTLSNEFLALERWLKAEGRAVRVQAAGDLESVAAAHEGTILISQSCFDWNEDAAAYLESWVNNGGVLVLCLDYYLDWDADEEPGMFLNRLGLEPGKEPEDESGLMSSGSAFPSYGKNIYFKEPEEKEALCFKDEDGLIRLVEFRRGAGKIIVTGRPRFMTNFYLDEEVNARLSWYLLAGGTDQTQRKEGILFIRGEERPEGIIGRIFREGNFTIIVISGIFLIIAGFWHTIPVFGLVKSGDEKPGKSLAARFAAEGNFLRRTGVRDIYRDVYFREIRRRLIRTENLAEEEIIPRAASVWVKEGGDFSAAEKALLPGRLSGKDFFKSIVILKTILERL